MSHRTPIRRRHHVDWIQKSAINKLLHAIENQSSRYGMKLNKNKCEVIKLNTTASIQIADSIREEHQWNGRKQYSFGDK